LLDLLLGEGTHLVRIDELWHERALRSWR